MTVSFPPKSGKTAQRPEMFETFSARFPVTHGGMTAAVKSLVNGYKVFYAQYQKTNADETATPAARLVRNAKAARAKLVPLIEQLDTASTDALKVSERARAKATEAYNPPNPPYAVAMRHAEIRAHLKSLPQGDRLKLLEAARTAGDEDTLIAIASYQPYLSAIPAQMHEFVRDQLIEAHAPEEAATMKAIGEQRAFAEQLRGEMLQSVGELIDFQKADEFIAAANDELAA